MAYLPRHLVWMRLVSFWLVNCQSVGFVRHGLSSNVDVVLIERLQAAGLVMVSSNMGGYTHRVSAPERSTSSTTHSFHEQTIASAAIL